MADRPTDSHMLQALIGSKKILGKELKAFQNMWDDLQMGRMVRLSKAQHAWVEKRFEDLRLASKPLPAPPPVKETSKVVFPWEKNGHREDLLRIQPRKK